MNMKRSARAISLLLLLSLALCSTALAVELEPAADLVLTEPSRSFTDTSTGAWYCSDLDTLVRAGGINGYEDGSFQPDAPLQMSEFLKILVSVMYPGQETAFAGSTMEGQVTWYAPYFALALQAGLLEGVNCFSKSILESTMSRYDMALVIENAAACLGEPLPDDPDVQYLIGDYIKIPPRYRDAVRKAYMAGILTGKDEQGNFQGWEGLTRAEVCAVVVRLYREEARRPATFTERWMLEDDGGTYEIRVDMPLTWIGQTVVFSVEDTGLCMVEYHAAACFEQYERPEDYDGSALLFSVILSDTPLDYADLEDLGLVNRKYAYAYYPDIVMEVSDNPNVTSEYRRLFSDVHRREVSAAVSFS
jgi:hypothetical protein